MALFDVDDMIPRSGRLRQAGLLTASVKGVNAEIAALLDLRLVIADLAPEGVTIRARARPADRYAASLPAPLGERTGDGPGRPATTAATSSPPPCWSKRKASVTARWESGRDDGYYCYLSMTGP